MPTLLLSTWDLPAAKTLAQAARDTGWRAYALDETLSPAIDGDAVYYGGSDTALAAADKFNLALLEPPLDLLARMPRAFLQRSVEFARFGDLHRLRAPTFIKPADPLNKAFDAGIYSNARDIRAPRGVPAETPVLLAEPLEWLAEYRCFVLNRKVAASSPYLSFGRPVWHPFGKGGEKVHQSGQVLALYERLTAQCKTAFPPAFVVDVGLIEDRGWAIVEFNPAWCAGLLGADPKQVLAVLRRASQNRDTVSRADKRWLIKRKDEND
jgi:hypothetical protein